MLKKVLQLILGLIIFALIIFFTDYSALKDISFKPIFFILIIFSSLCICLISSLKWSMLSNYFAGQKIIPFRQYFFYLILSRITAYFIFKDVADFGVRIGFLKLTKKINLYKSFHSVFFDRLIELIIAFLLAFPCILFFLNVISIWVALYIMLFVLFLLCGILIFSKYRFFIVFLKFLDLILRALNLISCLRKKIAQYKFIEQNKEIELPNFLFLKLILLTFLKFIFTVFQLYFVFLALSLKIPLIFIIISLPLVQLSFIFAFTPGGLGVFEAGWFILLSLFQVSLADIPVFLIGQRILIFASILIIGLFVFILQTFKNKKPVQNRNLL